MSFFASTFNIKVLHGVVLDYLWICQKELWIMDAVQVKDATFLIWFLQFIKPTHIHVAEAIFLMDNVDVCCNVSMVMVDGVKLSTEFLHRSSIRAFRAFAESLHVSKHYLLVDGLQICANDKRMISIAVISKPCLAHAFLSYSPNSNHELVALCSAHVTDTTLQKYVEMHGFTIPADMLRMWLPRISALKPYPIFRAMQMGHTSTESLLLFKSQNWIDQSMHENFFWQAVMDNDVNAASYFFEPVMLKRNMNKFLNLFLTFDMLNCFLDCVSDVQQLAICASRYHVNNCSRKTIDELMHKLNMRQNCKPIDFMRARWMFCEQDVVFDWFCEHDKSSIESVFDNPRILLAQLEYAYLNLHYLVIKHLSAIINLAFGDNFNQKKANLLLQWNLVNTANLYNSNIKRVARLGAFDGVFMRCWQKNDFYTKNHMFLIQYMCEHGYYKTLDFLLQADIAIDANKLLPYLEVVCKIGNLPILQKMTNLAQYTGDRKNCYFVLPTYKCAAFLWQFLPLSKTDLYADDCYFFEILCMHNVNVAKFIWQTGFVDNQVFAHGLRHHLLPFASSVYFDLDFTNQALVMQLPDDIHIIFHQKMCETRCILCGFCERELKVSSDNSVMLLLPFVQGFGFCLECFSKTITTCNSCLTLLHRFTQTISAMGAHPTLVGIRDVTSYHMVESLHTDTQKILTRICDLEFQTIWRQRLVSHMVQAHIVPNRAQQCGRCKMNRKLTTCQMCFESKCSLCFCRTNCHQCGQSSCFDCITSCSECKENICTKQCAKECTICDKIFCADCSQMMTCDSCFQYVCFDCQDTLQEFANEHMLCCELCSATKRDNAETQEQPQPHTITTELQIFQRCIKKKRQYTHNKKKLLFVLLENKITRTKKKPITVLQKQKRKKKKFFLKWGERMPDPRSQSSKPLQQVDLNQTSCSDSSNSSHSYSNDVELVLSSSGRKPDYEVKFCNDEPDPRVAVATPKFKLPFLVFAWQFLARGTLCVFVLLNDLDKHQDTQSLMYMFAAMLTLLNMLLLSVLKSRKNSSVACVYAVLSSVESVVLVLFADFLWITLPALFGAWLLLLIASINPCYSCYICCKRKCNRQQQQSTEADGQFIHLHRKQTWWSRHNFLYPRIIWFLFLSILCEICNLVFFWFLMHEFLHVSDERKQRIIACCLNLKLLTSTYTRHMLFERKFSYLAMFSEFVLFATTTSIVYCLVFLALADQEQIILQYVFWIALGLEAFVNLVMFVKYSAHAF